ncbi:hypothetical protein CTI14_69035, partial [Methylobacterium radiotolerans]
RHRVEAADPRHIDVAFFSRDLYEGSSLRKPGPLSDAFFPCGVRLQRHRVEAADPRHIDVAFFSRDLYEGSSLRKPGP